MAEPKETLEEMYAKLASNFIQLANEMMEAQHKLEMISAKLSTFYEETEEVRAMIRELLPQRNQNDQAN